MSKLYPILLKPVYQDNIWGGTQIPKRYNILIESLKEENKEKFIKCDNWGNKI